MRFPENFKVVPVASNQDLSGGATTYHYTDSINMKGYHRATFIVTFHEDLAGESPILSVWSGAADATYSSQLSFNYAFGSAAITVASADVLAATTTGATSLTITHGTYDNYMLIVEVDASAMDIANNEDWLTLAFYDTGGAVVGTICAFAILEPRYTGAVSATALA